MLNLKCRQFFTLNFKAKLKFQPLGSSLFIVRDMTGPDLYEILYMFI